MGSKPIPRPLRCVVEVAALLGSVEQKLIAGRAGEWGYSVMARFGGHFSPFSVTFVLWRRLDLGDIYTFTFGGGALCRKRCGSWLATWSFVIADQEKAIVYECGRWVSSFAFRTSCHPCHVTSIDA